MKVQEKGSDRKAEVHLLAQGQVTELNEYGQYIDETDGAICCYVPVEEGMVLKIESHFWGTVSEPQSTAVTRITRNRP